MPKSLFKGKNNGLCIGIPRALLYHKYGVLWETFFKELGIRIIVSPETNKKIISKGIKYASDESCLSVKIFLGHIEWLKDKCDAIFIPYLFHLYKNEETCVKFMGTADIARNTFPGIKILEYAVGVSLFKRGWARLLNTGIKLTGNPILAAKAYLKATKSYNHSEEEKFKEQIKRIKNKNNDQPTILLASHPYTIYDNLLGKPLVEFLNKLEINVVYSDAINKKMARKLSANLSKSMYWTFHKELLGAVEFYKQYVDGIIFLVTFPCGPDALAINLCQYKLKDIPNTLVTLDELESKTGLETRFESFIDILKLRKMKNGNR